MLIAIYFYVKHDAVRCKRSGEKVLRLFVRVKATEFSFYGLYAAVSAIRTAFSRLPAKVGLWARDAW